MTFKLDMIKVNYYRYGWLPI